MEYKIFYSSRRTLSLGIKDGRLIVRAPFGTSKKAIEKVIDKHSSWISLKLVENIEKNERFSSLTEDEIEKLKSSAKIYFNEKIRYFSDIMNLKCSRIKITSAKTRFGSCSYDGNICFSYRLMLYPESAREYVIVHELAHLFHMNHSKEFYSVIESVLPDYKIRRALLKK